MSEPAAKRAKRSLTAKQEEALACVRAGHNVVICGEAGCGKSEVVRIIREQLPNAWITAMTGVAASHVDGTTVHQALGVGCCDAPIEETVGKICKRPDMCKLLRNPKLTVVVDEVSMMSSDVFEYIDVVMQRVRRNQLVWGGIQLVFVGDWRQLPPVKGQFVFKSPRFDVAFPKRFYLDQNFRQAGNYEFQEMLLRVAENRMTEEDHARLRACLVSETRVAPEDALHVYGLNAQVDARNRERLDAMPGMEVVHTAKFAPHMTESRRQQLLKEMRVNPTLTLKRHVQVMLIKNLDTDMVSGTTGVIEDPTVPTWRVHGTVNVQSLPPAEWKPTGRNPSNDWVRTVPLIVAEALTVHRVQGRRFPKIVAKFTRNSFFAPGQKYVLLSRLPSLDGLYLLEYEEGCARTDQDAADFYALMKTWKN